MKLFKKTLCIALAAAMLCLPLSGCGEQTPQEMLLGEWQTADRSTSWIFYEDGTMAGGGDGDYGSASWHVDETSLTIDMPYEAMVFNYGLDGRKLSLYSEGELLGALYKVTGEDVDFEYDPADDEEMEERLKSSEVYAQAIAQLGAGGTAELTGVEGNMNANGDVGFHYLYETVEQYKYMELLKSYELTFAYSPFADDFYYAGREGPREEFTWDEEALSESLDTGYFQSVYEDGTLVDSEYLGMSADEEIAHMTYDVVEEDVYNYATQYITYEAEVSYNAYTEALYTEFGFAWKSAENDWQAAYGVWTYEEDGHSFTVTLNSVDSSTDSVSLDWNYDGTDGGGVYECEYPSGGALDCYVRLENGISVYMDAYDGLSCWISSGFFSPSCQMAKAA